MKFLSDLLYNNFHHFRSITFDNLTVFDSFSINDVLSILVNNGIHDNRLPQNSHRYDKFFKSRKFLCQSRDIAFLINKHRINLINNPNIIRSIITSTLFLILVHKKITLISKWCAINNCGACITKFRTDLSIINVMGNFYANKLEKGSFLLSISLCQHFIRCYHINYPTSKNQNSR